MSEVFSFLSHLLQATNLVSFILDFSSGEGASLDSRYKENVDTFLVFRFIRKWNGNENTLSDFAGFTYLLVLKQNLHFFQLEAFE